MTYQELQELEKILKMQLKMLSVMENFMKFDAEYERDHPEETLPPIINSGVLKSHFITQKKACEGFLSYTARHLPRMKKEHDIANKAKINERKSVTKQEPVTTNPLSNQNGTNQIPKIPIENPQVDNPAFMSLF